MQQYLVRYGVIPEVARYRHNGLLQRGDAVIINSRRGLQLGTVLEREHRPSLGEGDTDLPVIERSASDADLDLVERLRLDGEQEYFRWRERIAAWGLELELIDLEWTLDRSRLILYVLASRGPDVTSLALQAAAAGLGPVEVLPIAHEGRAAVGGQGCESGGCGCHH